MTFTVDDVFQQNLYNDLHTLRDHFLARHFLRYGILSASLGFSTIKNSLNRALSYQKDGEILMSFAAIVTLLREK